MARSALAALLSLAVLAVAPRPAFSQGPVLDSVRLGARVRVTAPPQPPIIGTFESHRGNDLMLLGLPSADTLRVALVTVRQLELSLGSRRQVLGKAWLGYLGGAAVGLLPPPALQEALPARAIHRTQDPDAAGD